MRRTNEESYAASALRRRLLARYDDGAGRDGLLGVDPAQRVSHPGEVKGWSTRMAAPILGVIESRSEWCEG